MTNNKPAINSINLTVADIQNDTDLIFVSDSQDVKEINDYLGNRFDFNSYFVKVTDGDYDTIYGMHGVVPVLSKRVYEIDF